jgi:bifunctional UDP-N-acetylglucosamine pyrophosphorylase/glucosamine-1-phosphate N-acetyltransferase
MNMTVVILAAGLGTRMRSKRAKVLHRAGGLTLVEHVVHAARAVAAPERIVVVTGHQADDVEALLAPSGVRFARQIEQKGTGHALMCAIGRLDKLEKLDAKSSGLVMVLYGDTPLLGRATLKQLRDMQASSDAAATLITATLEDPAGYGRVILNPQGDVQSIVEQKVARPEQLLVRLINSGIYCFRAALLSKHIAEIQPNNVSREMYLTDMAEILVRHGHRVQHMHVEDASELLGINTRMELADADRILRARKTRELMLAGVTIERPETVVIDAQVRVGEDTVIESFARLTGSTVVGEDCHIGQGAILESSALAKRVTVAPYTLIADSRIDPGAHVGPFARLRMDAQVGPEARIGNFVEVKKSRIGAGAKSQHLAYLGDAEIGERVNVGAGTITCNYDGEKKHGTKIGAGAFIGSNSTLVAPVEIGEDSYVAAGSVVTEAVPAKALALGRQRQINKPGWVTNRKKKKAAKKS